MKLFSLLYVWLLACVLLVVRAEEEEEEAAAAGLEAVEEEDKRAIVFVRKHIVETEAENYLVKDHKLVVEYSVFNVGDAKATDIQITDDGWPEDQFTKVKGDFPIKHEELAPQGHLSYNVTFKAIKEGVFPVKAVKVSYNYVDDMDGESEYTFPFKNLQVLTAVEFDKLTNKHTTEWTIFTASLAVPTALPLLAYIILNRSNVASSVSKKKK